MNRSYSKIRNIQKVNLILERRYLNEAEKDDMISKMGYSIIDSEFKNKKYIRNDNPKLSRSLYQPIVEYIKDYGNGVKVVGVIFEEGGGNPSIQLFNMELPDFSDCGDTNIHSMTKTITITNENINCVLNVIDGDIFEKKFLNK